MRSADPERDLLDIREARDVAHVAQFLYEKSKVESHQKVMKELQPRVKDFMEGLDDVDDKGTKEFVLPEPIEGFVRIQLIQARKTSRDEEAIRRILEERGLLDQCVEMVEVINDDEVARLAVEGVLTESDIDAMFPVKIESRLLTPKK